MPEKNKEGLSIFCRRGHKKPSMVLTKIRLLKKAGFFNIFSATVINSIVSFVYGIFIVRLLTKTEYGTFSYVQNILNFGTMFCCLGGNSGILQFCSEAIDVEKKYSYSKFAGKMGIVGSLAVPLAMLFYTQIDHSNIDSLLFYTAEFAALPMLFFVKEWVCANLRWQFKNREYAMVMNIHSVLNTLLAVLGAYFMGMQGVIIALYFSYAAADICGMFFLRGSILHGVREASELFRQEKNKFIKFSSIMCIVNALIAVLFSIDLFVIGNIMKDADQIAMYKTACTIPFALNMVPNSIMAFAGPHVALHKDESDWMRKNIRLLYLANGMLNITIGIILLIIAPVLIPMLFGNIYENVVPIFRIMVLSYIVNSCLRTPAANLLGNLRMARTALAVSAVTVAVSVTMGIILVGTYGIIGAALGSVCTFTLIGTVSTSIILYVVYIKPRFNRKI